MQENNFEKQVQQKTDELRLTPSDEVWQKVAASITKKQGGRRVLIALVLCLILTCSSVVIIFQYNGHKKINESISRNKSQDKTNHINEPIKNGQGAVEPGTDVQTAIEKHMPSVEKENIQQAADNDLLLNSGTSTANHKSGNNKPTLAVNHGEQAGALKNKNQAHYKTRGKAGVRIQSATETNINESSALNNTNKVEGPQLPVATNPNAAKEQLTDTIDIHPDRHQKQPGMLLPVVANSNEEVTPKGGTPTNGKSKWKFGAMVSLGVSTTQNGYMGIGPSGDDYKSLDAISIPTTGNTGGQGAPPRYYPSATKPGTAIIFGLFVEKAISNYTSFSAGLNYKVYHSSWMIGTRVDSLSNLSSANYYYRNGATYNYKNHFQFIELPVAARIKLGRQNKIPIYLHLGFSLSQLLGSNALQFDTLSGTYYKDNAVFNKTIANVSGGVLFSLTPKANNPLLIGPDISYSLNKMAQSGLYKDRHYSYIGIQVRKTVGKR